GRPDLRRDGEGGEAPAVAPRPSSGGSDPKRCPILDRVITLPSVAELTRELIRFDTTNPPGNEAACVLHLNRLLRDAGLETVIAAARFRAQGGRPPGDVVIAVLADEEAGGLEGAGWLAANRPDLFTGIRHAIGEGGGFALYVGGRRFYPLMVAEKRGCATRAT